MIKFNKIPVFLAVIVLIITATLGIWFLVDSFSGKDHVNLDIQKLYIVNIYGTEGFGYVDLQVDENYLSMIYDKTGIKLEASDLEVDISKENNLYNGDKFTLRLQNGEDIKNKGVRLDNLEVTYSVKGLKEGTDFDVFNDLEVYIKDGKAELNNERCSNFIKDNVDFFIKNQLETYKEGDTVIVGAHIDMNAATDNGYNIDKREHKFILKEQEKTND